MISKTIQLIKQKITENKKLSLIIFIGILGIILIFVSEVYDSNENNKNDNIQSNEQSVISDKEYIANLETKLTDIISSVDNAGEVKVMVTLSCLEEKVYAVNEDIKNDEKSSVYSKSYLIVDNKSSKEGVVLKVLEPKIQGVAVVCTGGDNLKVVSDITNLITSALGIGSNRVSVAKMK